jgi:hypothetical protein
VSALAEQLAAAISAQDGTAIAACFADDAEFRALTPPGLRERSGAAEIAALIARWYGDSSVLDLDDVRSEQIGDRLRISYRLTGVENDEPYVVEQHLFCVVQEGKIRQADLLCSGFRPRP